MGQRLLSPCQPSRCTLLRPRAHALTPTPSRPRSGQVGKGSPHYYKVRWRFENSDGSGPLTLPRVAITWLDMGGGEFVAVEKNSYMTYFVGAHFTVTDNWGDGGWATQFKGTTGSPQPNVDDPMTMTSAQQAMAVSVFFQGVTSFTVMMGREITASTGCCTKIQAVGASNIGVWPACAPSPPPSLPPPSLPAPRCSTPQTVLDFYASCQAHGGPKQSK